MSKLKLFHKIFNIFATFVVLIQSLSPVAFITPAYAQEATPTVSDTATPLPTSVQATDTPTDTTTPTPTQDQVTPTDAPANTDTVTPTPDTSTTPTDIPTNTVTPVPTDTTTPTDTPTDTTTPTPDINNNSSQGPPSATTDNSSVSNTPAPTTPTVTPVNQTSEPSGDINATILKNISAPSLDLSTQTSAGSATVTTNKADYSPTDTALISGSNFTPNKTYSLTVSSSDAPATSTTVNVTTDYKGAFVYAYQLDGNYRPNYSVVVKDGDTTVATTTFTDSNNPAANLEQCHNGNGSSFADCKDPSAPSNTWGSGNAGSSNAKLYEGNSQNYRLILTNMPINTATTVSISQQFTKGGKMAFDFPTGPGNLGTATTPVGLAGVFPCDNNGSQYDNPCDHSVPSTTTAGKLQISSIPSGTIPDSTVDSEARSAQTTYYAISESTSPTRSPNFMYVYGATPGSFGGYTFTGTSSDVSGGDTKLNWTFTVTPTSSTVVVAWGAHISKSGDYGTKGTAVTISGSPYHTIYNSATGITGGGNQDMQMAAGAVLPQPGLSTQVSSSTITLGQSVTDTATYTEVINGTGQNAKSIGPVTGTTQFYVCGPTGSATSCTSTSTPVGSAVTNSNDSATSSSFTPTQAGTYCFAAYYTPDSTAQYASTSSTVTTNECVTVNNPPTGTIELKKIWSGTAGQTTLNIGTSANGTQTASVQTGVNGANPLTTGAKTVNAGTYYVSETGGLSNYNSALVCTDNGNGVTPGANNSVNVAQNHTVVCTFTNTRQTGTITVKKTINPAIDQGTFNLQIDSTTKATGGDGTTTNQVTVDTGLHSIAETSANSTNMANYTSSYSCVDAQTQASVASGTGTSASGITVSANQNIVCTFTNTRNTVDLKVKKIVNDGSALTDWAFSLDGANAISADANGNVDFGPVTTNVNHTITEGGADQSNYTLVSVTGTNCTNNNDGTSATANIPNGASSTTCTFTNNRNTGTVQVKKIVSPSDNGATSWDFSISGPTNNSATGLHDGDSSSAYTSATGNYSVTESGTNLSSYTTTYSCSDGTNSLVSGLGATTSTFTVLTGKNVVCTFTNTIKNGKVVVTKYQDDNANGTQDQGENGLENWTINLSNNGSQVTDSTGVATFASVLPGTYTLSETFPDNTWSQSNIACDNGTYDSQNGTYSVTVGADQTVNCTIGNYQKAHIVVTKDVVDPDGNPITDTSTSFPFAVSGSSDNPSLTDGDSHTFDVTPGVHTITETPDTNYDFAGCNTGLTDQSGNAVITVTSGQTANVTCTNKQKKATITVVKDVLASDGSQVSDDHTFQVTVNGETKDFAEGSNATFSVNPGTYSGVETNDSSYTEYSNDSPVTVSSNGSATITIVNKQNSGTISGHKFQADGVTGIANWTINLFKCTANDFLSCVQLTSTTTANDGSYSFTDLVTGFYQVVEGLVSTYTPVSDTSHNVTVMPGSTTENQDFSNFKNINITVCKVEDKDGNLQTTNDQTNVSGWTINLLTDGKVSDTQQTGENGCYTFQNLGPNHTYSAEEVVQDGWIALTPTTHEFDAPQDGVDQTYTFINSKKAHIIVTKQIGDTTDNTVTDTSHKFNFTISGDSYNQNFDLTGGQTSDTYDVAPGTYDITEAKNGSYTFEGCSATIGDQTVGQGINNGEEVVVGSGDTVNIVCRNDQLPGTTNGFKFNDLNSNGDYYGDCTFNEDSEQLVCEPKLPGWTIFVDLNHNGVLDPNEPSTVTDANGNYSFTLNPGEYAICEVNQPGWTQTYPNDPENHNCNLVGIGSNDHGGTQYFGNHQDTPVLTISKSNDTEGNDKHPGDSVIYTITLTNTGAPINNVLVTDLLPKGFVYHGGSWTATLNGNPISIPEPVYHSPGKWQVGSMQTGDTVVLTYKADIDNSEKAGLYSDVAWASGQSLSSVTILAQAQPTGFVDTDFVGTSANVVTNPDGQSFNVVHTTQAVLGAATSILPATGADAAWIELAIFLLISGGLFVIIGFKLKKKYA